MAYLLENGHRDALTAAFGALRPGEPFDPPDLDYLFILYTNRCGSNFLASALASTGQLPQAGEIFNAETVRGHAQQRRLGSLRQYFTHLPDFVPHTAWLAAKLAVSHVDLLTEAGILPRIRSRTRFILLERQDRLAQAISRSIAWQNQQWTSEQAKAIPDAALVYARPCIEQQLRQIERENGLLYRFLTDAGATPFHLSYEALIADPASTIRAIGDWLGLPGLRFDPSRVPLTRQGNAVNAVWRRRYLQGSANTP